VAAGALGAILRAHPIEAGEAFGPPDINRLLGFNLFPAPVVLPGGDPMGAPSWQLRVGGNEPDLMMVGFTGRGIIRAAYGLNQRMPIVGVPRWMDNESFDLTALADLTIVNGLTDPAEVQAAIRQMLEERLGLRTHREARTFPAYALVRASRDGRLGPSLKPSTIDCFAGGSNPRPDATAPVVGPVLRERTQGRRTCGFDDTLFGVSGARVTLQDFASEFHRRHYPMAPDREIVDRTGLTGAYDLELRFGFLPLAAIGHAHYRVGRLLEPFGIRSFSQALPEQLGLKLVDTTISREVLVIDRINRP
jgi:uncharacterized protein (TIGR03435 family)